MSEGIPSGIKGHRALTPTSSQQPSAATQPKKPKPSSPPSKARSPTTSSKPSWPTSPSSETSLSLIYPREIHLRPGQQEDSDDIRDLKQLYEHEQEASYFDGLCSFIASRTCSPENAAAKTSNLHRPSRLHGTAGTGAQHG